MPFIDEMPQNAGPPVIYAEYPAVYGPWGEMSQALMNGPSPLSRGTRELVFAYASGVAGCEFTYVAHSEVAYALGVPDGSIGRLLADPDDRSVGEELMPLLSFVRKLALTPTEIGRADVAGVLAAGFERQALDDAVAIVGRAMFMRCLAQAYGFEPMDRERAARRAAERVEHGYVDLYSAARRRAEGTGHPS